MIWNNLIKAIIVFVVVYIIYKSGIYRVVYDVISNFFSVNFKRNSEYLKYEKKKKKFINKVIKRNKYNDEI